MGKYKMRESIKRILLENESLDDSEEIITMPNGCYYCGCEVANITEEVLEQVYQAGRRVELLQFIKASIDAGISMPIIIHMPSDVTSGMPIPAMIRNYCAQFTYNETDKSITRSEE